MTAAAEPLRRRLSLTQPQATESTTVLEWAPEGPGEPRGGAPVDREGPGEPRGGAPVDREGGSEPNRSAWCSALPPAPR
jgi:hypothetical protein